jgi:hypothetical protein
MATNGFRSVGAVASSDNQLKAFVVFGKQFKKAEEISIPVGASALVVAKSLIDANTY